MNEGTQRSTSEFERKVKAKRKLIAKHQKELKELLDTCTHEGHVVQKESYFSGSYYDKAYTEYWNQCELCGARSESTYKTHSWYG